MKRRSWASKAGRSVFQRAEAERTQWRQCGEPLCRHRRRCGEACPKCGTLAWVVVEPEAEQ